MNIDHIITDAKTGKFKCEFCGTEESRPFMPEPIDVTLDAMDYFIGNHKYCSKPPAEAVMSEYIKGFDAGYSYVLTEVEKWIKRKEYDPQCIALELSLLAHLKMEKENGTREST